MQKKSYIADFHLNLHPNQMDLLEKWLDHCHRFCDFFTLAYYPYQIETVASGFKTEKEIPVSLMAKQWNQILETVHSYELNNGFICFPGFEWQGQGKDGDHNVYFKDTGSIALPPRYSDLAQIYKHQDAIAIPHHLAYALGHRGKNWLTHNEVFSPLVEIYSHHGSSEQDDTPLAMTCHRFMGPRVDETSVLTGLKKGKHFGIIAAGDNHSVPAEVQNGRMGVWADSYTKDDIWNSLLARCTYGFTKSRIDTWYTADSAPMGSQIRVSNGHAVNLDYKICGNSYIQRVELYKDGHIHDMHFFGDRKPAPGSRFTFKFFIEFGWGPNPALFPDISSRLWEGIITTSGNILSVEPVFSSFENNYSLENEHSVAFTAKSQNIASSLWMRETGQKTEGFIIEIESDMNGIVRLDLPTASFEWSVSKILNGSFVEILETEAKELIAKRAGIEHYYRSDAWYHNAYKIKVHRGYSSENYRINGSFSLPAEDTETSWFIKAIQADGQTAWGSPIWISR